MTTPHLAFATREPDTAAAMRALAEAAGPLQGGVVFVFHSMVHAPGAVAELAARAFPEALVAGCSTMGEVGPEGLIEGGLSALVLAPPARAAARFVPGGQRFEAGAPLIEDLAAELGASLATLSGDRHVLITLTEGLQGSEERLVASLGLAAPRVPLVGGSAGDDFRMKETWVHLGGEARSGQSLVLLLEPRCPFAAFAIHHYRPEARRVVVTRAEPSRRLVLELDGWPARRVLAELLGVDEDALLREPGLPSARAHALAYAVGGDLFMRGVMRVEGEGLVMGGAVEEGVVLRCMRGGDLVAETRAGLRDRAASLGGDASARLLFNCGGRLLLARAQGLQGALGEAMAEVPSAGFCTYGEQFGPLHLNQTLAGLILGR